MSPRNVFENNEVTVEADEADLNELKDAPHVMLPPLAEGHEYVFKKLPSGRTAVTVVESVLERCTCGPNEGCSNCPKPEKDQFGRHFAQ